jgi:hypothetical protein
MGEEVAEEMMLMTTVNCGDAAKGPTAESWLFTAAVSNTAHPGLV